MTENNRSFDLRSAMEGLRRRRRSFLMVAGAVLLVGLSIVFSLPSIYRSESTVLIERQIAAEMVTSTVTGELQERLQVLQQRVLTDERLLALADQLALFDSEEELDEEDRILVLRESLEIVSTNVQVTEDRGGKTNSVVIAFNVAYQHTDPERARQMAESLTDLLLTENRSLRTEQTGQVTTFLGKTEQRLREDIRNVEEQIAALKKESFSFLPEQVAEARRELAQRQEDLITANGEISFLQSQAGQLEQRLNVMPKHVFSNNENSAAMQDPGIRLQQARLELELARQNYTENHPDVVALKQRIKELERETGGSRGTQDLSVPTNPDYILLVQQKSTVQSQLEGARARKTQLENLIKEYEQRITTNPAVELRYNQLLRDLERAQEAYADIKARSYQAELAEMLEQEQRGERFTLLAKPVTPKEPVEPSRIALSFLVLVLSLISGGATAYLAELRDRTLKSSRDVLAVTGSNPIAVIPVIDLHNA